VPASRAEKDVDALTPPQNGLALAGAALLAELNARMGKVPHADDFSIPCKNCV